MSSRYAKKRKHELDSDTSDKKHSSTSERHNREKKSRRRESSGSPTPDGSGNADSMSIEETNKMRASLGLAPLEVDDGPKIRESESGDPKEKIVTEDGMEFVHKPSENLAQKKKTEKLKEKLELQKHKRIVQSKLKSKGLADTSSDEEENAETWVEKQRRLAEQKARELEQMDEDAEKAVTPVVKKARKPGSAAASRPKDTSGMIVGHSKDTFLTGEEQILVLDDRSVLDEDGDEVLVNPTLMYAEQLKKNREIREKKSGYNPYDEEEVDEFGVVKRKDLLSKYDEGIDGPQTRETFKLDEHGGVDINREAEELQQKRNLFMANRKLQTLETPKYKIASEFYTEEEMISFRKPKKKKDGSKSRKRKGELKADELMPEAEQETLEERKAREERLKARRQANGESSTALESNGAAADKVTKMEVDKEEGEIEDDAPVIKKELFRNTMGATIDKSKMHSLLSKIKKREEEDDEEEDDFESMDNLDGVVIDDEVEEDYSSALEKARKLRELEAQKDKTATADSGAQVKEMLSRIKKEEEDEMDVDDNGDGPKQIIFDSTSEYYKTIGNIPTIGLAGNRDDAVDYSEVIAEQAKELAEKEDRAQRRKQEKADENSEDERRHRKKEKKRSHREKEHHRERGDDRRGDRNGDRKDDKRDRDDRKHREKERKHRNRDRSSSPEEDKKKEDKNDKDKYENVLGKEADVTKGVAGMLKLAGEKGYLEDPNSKRARGGTLKHLESKIVAKVEFSKYDIDDKHLKKLERMGTTGSGPLRSFPEKRDYVPNVEIQYTDAQGRDMDQKAAFRVLSHKFHGKAPGKKQIEKRMRQQDKKEKLKKMNSSDTPLGTLSKQIKKQEQLQSHFLVLSGGRNDANAPLQKD